MKNFHLIPRGTCNRFLVNVFGLSTVLALFLAAGAARAQSSSAVSNKTDAPNFYEIKKHYDDLYKVKPVAKGTGYKVYRRWEWYWEQRVGRSGVFPPNNVVVSEWEKYANAYLTDNAADTAANWTFMGPGTTTGGYAGMGRVNCMAFDPKDKNTFWVGTPSGGLWKTTNYGQTWTNFGNILGTPVLGVSDIVIDSVNPQIMYIATGDADGGSLGSYNGTVAGDTKSIGILKSVDGGVNWTPTGLNWNVSQNLLISRLMVNPRNSKVMFTATSKGIFRTTDGGVTFDTVQVGYFMDICYKPWDTTILHASSRGIVNTSNGFTPSGQIWKSADGGRNWVPKTTLTGVGRIKLAVTPNRPELVEGLCSNTKRGFHSLQRSINSGETFMASITLKANLQNNYLNAAAPGKITGNDGQGEYDLFYLINPGDSTERWIGAVNTWKSVRADSFALKTYWTSYGTSLPVTHADKHWFAFHPLEPGTLFDCNDGGVYYTKNKGGTWIEISNGLQIGQIYKIGNAYSDSRVVIAGFQDNGTQVHNSGTWISPSVIGGDGMTCQVGYVNPKLQYSSYCEDSIYRSNDPTWHWQNVYNISNNIPGKTPGSWVTPFVLNPKDTNMLYVGRKMKLFKGTERGDKFVSVLTLPSPVPTYDSCFRQLAISRNNPQLMYASTGYKLFKTKNGWTNSNVIALPDTNMMITGIAINEDKPDTVFITYSGYTDGVKVFRIYSDGSKWDNISKSLPNLPVNCVEFHEKANDAVYVGTDVGVYYRNSSMTGWKYFSKGLPNVVVTDLKIQYKSGKIRAATYGRGLWESNLYTPTGKVQLNIVEIPIIGGKATGDGLYNPGQKASMKAIPESGWKFAGWYNDDVLISDSLDFEFTVNEDDNLVGLFTQSTGIADADVKSQVRIYPNPTKGIVNISVDGGLRDDLAKVVVTALDGRTVYDAMPARSGDLYSIDPSAHLNGSYLLTLYFKSGAKVTYSVVVR